VIVHKTFAQRKGMTSKRILDAQQEVRARAQHFIAHEIDSADVVNITESSVILPLTELGFFSVTVWYRKKPEQDLE
jgi:uncharacterized protein YhbP (UPF0306 family)